MNSKLWRSGAEVMTVSICPTLSFCVFHLLLFPSLHNLQFNLEFPFIAYSVLYGAGNCIWRRIYQSNFHNIKNQFSAQALGMKPGVLWPSSAWFGPILCSIGQAHYASALAQILNPSISTGITPAPSPKKFLGSVQAVASKVTPCHRVLICHCGGPSATRKSGTCTWREPHTCTRHHTEVGEVTNYPLRERVLRVAVRRHIVQMGQDRMQSW